MNIKEEVKKVIAKALEVGEEEVVDGKNLYESIGVDSTEMVEVCLALGKHFDTKIQANEVNKDSTPEDIVKIVEQKKEGN
ncbi:MAG: acyl carrier protein [Candidatus Omnitrophica bacterium]|nr:acyl carrier protein [Candidatus Omnitrophota bacterium]MCF7895308.1 acyl carrier protein [Candidatus Omnitrophota bacterium]